MSPFERYAVVRVPFPFTDRQVQKLRPAVVLSQSDFQRGCGHLLLAMITSARQSSWPLDWPLEDLQAAGLPQPCLVRFKLFTLDERLVSGGLGSLAPADRAGVEAQLGKLLPTAT
ncbi:type II toxin-antitoxin system PemK/MazF family toxin [Cyanobium sp. N5-Cardenillas]|uniref:type II toxin-antitoxin system PemK/MazF family toxin n=1 Tax=Cyanobium sp. N5-Cardenillas TaxID=2823720 RepID=UPI0020CDDB7A|nr:type II toxin-antitoxin system PemK/MazF family toxin [Cyanobium sp. N5-Cardenillas]